MIFRDALKIIELAAALVLPVSLALAPTYPLLTLLAAGAAIFLAAATFFFLYAEAMRLKALRDKQQLSLRHYPWAFVVLGVGLPFDATLNVAGVYWREWPRWRSGEILLTARLRRWVKDDAYPARRERAQRVCRVLNRYDEGHC